MASRSSAPSLSSPSSCHPRSRDGLDLWLLQRGVSVAYALLPSCRLFWTWTSHLMVVIGTASAGPQPGPDFCSHIWSWSTCCCSPSKGTARRCCDARTKHMGQTTPGAILCREVLLLPHPAESQTWSGKRFQLCVRPSKANRPRLGWFWPPGGFSGPDQRTGLLWKLAGQRLPS